MKRMAIDLQALGGRMTGHRVYLEGVWGALKELHDPGLETVPIDAVGRELNTVERTVWDQVLLPLRVRRVRVDALFVPAFSVPRFSPVPVVTTAHDLTALLYPQTLGAISRWYWSRLVPKGLTRAHVIIAISQWTKQKLIEMLRIPEERISVVPLGLDERFRTAPSRKTAADVSFAYHLPDSFVLTVGTLEPKRNHATLIEAYARLASPPPLLIVGGRGSAYESVMRLIAKKRLERTVRIVEGVTSDELSILYRKATVLVIPSLDEGFGLPALEGMASGVAIAAARSGALPEVLRDAADYFTATEEEDLAQTLGNLLGDRARREDLGERGKIRSQAFSWKKTAEETLAIFKRVCV